MEDIAPKLLEKIQKDFQTMFDKSEIISKLYAKVRDGTATYKEANEFSVEVGHILANAYGNNLSSEVLPDGKMYYNIAKRVIRPTMENNYHLITEVTKEVQRSLNSEAGIGIKPIIPELNQDRIDGILNRISSEDIFDDVKWILGEPVVNFSQSIVDDAIKVNAEFHGKAGMKPKIVRKMAGNCCEWCKAVTGKYFYPDVPQDVYRRHQRCRCTVDYVPGDGKVQNVHTKQWRKEDGSNIRLEKRKEQHYLPVKGSGKLSLTDRKMGIINLIEIDGYSKVYVEEGVKIKPKALHTITKNIDEAIDFYRGDKSRKPIIAVVAMKNLNGALGKYDCVQNVIYIAPDTGDAKMLSVFFAMDKNVAIGSTEYHETWHWMQAQGYKGTITEANRNVEYMPWLVEKCKKNIVSLGINEYNVNEISSYAAKAFVWERYDEVEAEYYTLKCLKRGR
ncbi:MAG: hypothetical protein E7299_04860 [Lachnospiraceae bacterium]|nr:hypothetical protein [Lachnospiraceae bacterium]